MIDYNSIARACSMNDSLSEKHKNLKKIADGLEVSTDGMMEAAKQRSLRALILFSTGRDLSSGVVPLNMEEAAVLWTYMGVWVDGFIAGVRSRIDEEDERSG